MDFAVTEDHNVDFYVETKAMKEEEGRHNVTIGNDYPKHHDVDWVFGFSQYKYESDLRLTTKQFRMHEYKSVLRLTSNQFRMHEYGPVLRLKTNQFRMHEYEPVPRLTTNKFKMVTFYLSNPV